MIEATRAPSRFKPIGNATALVGALIVAGTTFRTVGGWLPLSATPRRYASDEEIFHIYLAWFIIGGVLLLMGFLLAVGTMLVRAMSAGKAAEGRPGGWGLALGTPVITTVVVLGLIGIPLSMEVMTRRHIRSGKRRQAQPRSAWPRGRPPARGTGSWRMSCRCRRLGRCRMGRRIPLSRP